jgi:hypothetical protein
MAIHRGRELNNVKETWQQNEQQRRNDNAPGTPGRAGDAANADDDLQQTIKEEAAEYDKANKEERLLGGDRATVNDDKAQR